MATASERIDAYIADKADLARPILEHIRALIGRYAPHAEEAIKWGMPAWTYRGKLLAGMAAFQRHATMSFWHGDVVKGAAASREAMGQFGRLTSIDDLPPEPELAALIARALKLIEDGAPASPAFKRERPAVDPPEDFLAALAASPAAHDRWPGLAPSWRREYLEWIVEAKRAETRERRIRQTLAQVAESKSLQWRYQPSRPARETNDATGD